MYVDTVAGWRVAIEENADKGIIMQTETDSQTDILWRVAPWLTLAAMTMTVLSYPPVEASAHRNEVGGAGKGCENPSRHHMPHTGTVMIESVDSGNVERSG